MNNVPLKEIISKFSTWFELAKTKEKFPDAACLSTLNKDGYPEGRIILVRRVYDDGFGFFTNSHSQKGSDLKRYPKASLTFHWETLGYQVRVVGDISLLDAQKVDDYFQERPWLSQVGTWASLQSERYNDPSEFSARVEQYKKEFEGKSVPRPEHWLGYKISPVKIEFWEDRPFRLHYREQYTSNDHGQWSKQLLYP